MSSVVVVVVLDACVLFPFTLRDTLLRVAEARLYQVRWTDEILEEVRRNLVKTDETTEEQAERLIQRMNQVFKYAHVANYKHLIPSMTNDPKDRHVAAAAVACKAQIIVTFNLRHFSRPALGPFGIQAQSPDTFLANLLAAHPQQIQQIIQQQAQDYAKPPITLAQLLNVLAKQVPRFASLLRQSLDSPS